MSALPLDQVTRRILLRLSAQADVDAAAVAKAVGVTEDVARARLQTLSDEGLLGGVDVRLPRALTGMACEYLVSGVPTTTTDKGAIERLCGSPGVTRVFGLASSHGLAFTVQGTDVNGAHQHSLALAREAGLEHATAVMILTTFQDRRTLPMEEGHAR